MSFSRFGEADVYVFEHVGGYIQCCGCSLSEGEIGIDDNFGMYDADTPREMLAHLDRHEEAGDDVDITRLRILKAYEDLDAPIEPYVRSEEEEAMVREKLRKQFPPESFRDIANGE